MHVASFPGKGCKMCVKMSYTCWYEEKLEEENFQSSIPCINKFQE